ncbi:MAG: secondary thiamine-phosphate synthase enzyme YjbQ [Chloroflexi bacterium]|nr:secondary thiamine-phosphate synthase enzyme YjbQ [Chloroflexota bacterium]
MRSIPLHSSAHSVLIDITQRVQTELEQSGVGEGVCFVHVPHTTAAVVVQENADPDVPHDILATLERLVPWQGPYRHGEGNAAAHVKAALVGSSVAIPVHEGHLGLGTWQAIFFCEFDGPRGRQVHLQVVAAI